MTREMCRACGERPVGGSRSGLRCAWCAEYGAPLKEPVRFGNAVIRNYEDGSIRVEIERPEPRIETAHEYLERVLAGRRTT